MKSSIRNVITNPELVAIIFSKDRAMQVDACIRTFALHCTDGAICQKRVIFKCSDARHAAQYSALRMEHPDFEFIAESDFHHDLQEALAGFKYVVFMVDDNLFVRPFRLGNIVSALDSETSAIGFSLRLGRNVEVCYSHNDARQKIPAAVEIPPAKEAGGADDAGKTLRFPWIGAPYDFGYPLEVSSSVFRVPEILSIISDGEKIRNPNALEARIDSEKGRFTEVHPDLLCFESSVAFCNPLNVVQHDYQNRSRAESASSVSSLMERFELGYRFDVKRLAGFVPSGCHQETEVEFLPPRLGWEKIRAGLQITCERAAAESAGPFAPRAVDCEIESRNLGDDSLQSILTALHLLDAVSRDASVSWVEALGKSHREKLALQSEEFAAAVTALKERLRSIFKYSAEQGEATVKQGETIAEQDREIAGQREAISELTRKLAAAEKVVEEETRLREAALKDLDASKWQLARIHEKWSFRIGDRIGTLLWSAASRLGRIGGELNRRFPVVDYVRGWIRYAEGRRGVEVQIGKALFHIDEYSRRSDGRFHFHGWLILKKTRSATKVRAEVFSPGKHRGIPAVIQARPDIAAHFNEPKKAYKCGFEIEGSLPEIGGFVTLQYFCDKKWLTFAWFAAQKETSAETPPAHEPWPKSKPLISVVIPCHNGGKNLAEAVDSVLAQTWQDLEVIVVDDGSDDAETIRTLDELRAPRTRVIRQQNLKLPGARNTGIQAAAGKYLCCLDEDDKLEPTYIEKCLVHLVRGEFDICGSWQRSPGTEDAVHRPEGFGFQNLLESNRMTNSAIFPRSLWEAAGGFDETMENGHQMWDFWIRAASLGARATVVPEPLYLHREHGRSVIDEATNKHDANIEKIRQKNCHTIPWTGARPPKTNRWTELLSREQNPQKPHVLLCLPFLTIGGAEKILSQVCIGLRAHGFQFTIITTVPAHSWQGDSASWFEPATSEIFRLPEFLAPELWNPFIAYLISSRRMDILWQAGSTYIYELLPDLKTLFPELKVIDILFNEVGHTANNRRYDYLIDLNVTESNSTKSWLVARGESPDRVRVIPNGVNLSSWRPRGEVPIPFETGGKRFIAGFFGRMSEEKGPDIFVEIAERLRHEKDILFVIGGHGPMENSVRRRISDAGLEDSVKLLGFCSTHTHLACCDVLVLPSRQDGRPNIVMEAMAMGVPVIASRVGGLSELVLDGYSGYLCEAANVGQFADTISRLCHDQSLCKRLKESAQIHAREHFDIGRTIAAFAGAFSETIRQPAKEAFLETTAA